MRREFSKIIAGLDFYLLQDQKMTLINMLDRIPSTECKEIEHLNGIISFMDKILDKAESNALWSFEEWAKKNNFPLEDIEVS